MIVTLTKNKYRIIIKGTDKKHTQALYDPNNKNLCTHIFYDCLIEETIERLLKENYKLIK